jgi:hypothetical protein
MDTADATFFDGLPLLVPVYRGSARRGASVNLYSVTQAAVARINPTEDGCLAVDNQKNERLEALLRIA